MADHKDSVKNYGTVKIKDCLHGFYFYIKVEVNNYFNGSSEVITKGIVKIGY